MYENLFLVTYLLIFTALNPGMLSPHALLKWRSLWYKVSVYHTLPTYFYPSHLSFQTIVRFSLFFLSFSFFFQFVFFLFLTLISNNILFHCFHFFNFWFFSFFILFLFIVCHIIAAMMSTSFRPKILTDKIRIRLTNISLIKVYQPTKHQVWTGAIQNKLKLISVCVHWSAKSRSQNLVLF